MTIACATRPSDWTGYSSFGLVPCPNSQLTGSGHTLVLMSFVSSLAHRHSTLPDVSILERGKYNRRTHEQRDQSPPSRFDFWEHVSREVCRLTAVCSKDFEFKLQWLSKNLCCSTIFWQHSKFGSWHLSSIGWETFDVLRLSKHMSDMLAMQDSLLSASAKELLRTDLLHLSSMEQAKHTEYEPNSYVLVYYRTGAPPTRLHIFGRGPIQVVSRKDSRYLLKDLISHKEKEYHVSDMKPFIFDPSTTNPTDIARRDHLEFFVDKVFRHRGDLKSKRDLEFHVKWLDYDESRDSWEPYSALRDTSQLHEYLWLHKLDKLSLRKFKTWTLNAPMVSMRISFLFLHY